MSTPPGWVILLSAIRERFEAILSENITLTLYVSPDPTNPVGAEMPSPFGDKFKNQCLAGGMFPAGSFYHDYSSYSFFANPIAPSFEYRNLQVNYYNSAASRHGANEQSRRTLQSQAALHGKSSLQVASSPDAGAVHRVGVGPLVEGRIFQRPFSATDITPGGQKENESKANSSSGIG